MWVSKHNPDISRTDAPYPGEQDDWVYVGDKLPDQEKPAMGWFDRFEKELMFLAIVCGISGVYLIWEALT